MTARLKSLHNPQHEKLMMLILDSSPGRSASPDLLLFLGFSHTQGTRWQGRKMANLGEMEGGGQPEI